jgi:CheY-like chemotaxis protein
MAIILIVDDDADSREAVARYLVKAGHTIRTARNGRDALLAISTTMPDVIVLDAQMPQMTGVEFLEVVRGYLRWSTLPVVLLTAYPQGPHIERARELEVKRVFLKANFEMADLLRCVERLAADAAGNCDDGAAGGGAA